MYKLFFSFLLAFVLFLGGCQKNVSVSQSDSPSTDAFANSGSEKAQNGYIDQFVFLGESTTYHMKSRGVLSGGTATTQVWAPKSGTLMLDPSTAYCRIVYPETGEELELEEALKRKKPKYIMLTFGLNGATANVEKGKVYFKSCYTKLVNTINSASPNTIVLLQSCFPIGKTMDMSSHSVDACTLNGHIDRLNGWTHELCTELSLYYVDTAQILKDTEGFLKKEFCTEDGYHLTKSAYVEIIEYIQTHRYGGQND